MQDGTFEKTVEDYLRSLIGLQAVRLSLGFLVLTILLVALCMGLAYLAAAGFVANWDALGFVWRIRASIDTNVLAQYCRDRNLFLAIGAACGLVISLYVGFAVSIRPHAHPPRWGT